MILVNRDQRITTKTSENNLVIIFRHAGEARQQPSTTRGVCNDHPQCLDRYRNTNQQSPSPSGSQRFGQKFLGVAAVGHWTENCGNTATGIPEGAKVKDKATVKEQRANLCRQGHWESQAQQPQWDSSATKLQRQENSHVLRQLVSMEPTRADTYSTGVLLAHLFPVELQVTKCYSVL